MLSRVADSIYWMSRYFERAENIARFIDVNLQLTLDSLGNEDGLWKPLVIATGDEEPFQQRYPIASRKSVLHFLTFDRENSNSIYSCTCRARENARTVREIISSEMWEQINTAYLFINGASLDALSFDALSEFYTRIKNAHHLFKGITDSTMS